MAPPVRACENFYCARHLALHLGARGRQHPCAALSLALGYSSLGLAFRRCSESSLSKIVGFEVRPVIENS